MTRSYLVIVRANQLAALEFLWWVANLLVVRLVASLSLACLTTIGLLFFMQSLIETGAQSSTTTVPIRIVDATMPEIELEVIKEIERPQMIELVVRPPLEKQQSRLEMNTGPALPASQGPISSFSKIERIDLSISNADSEFFPLISVRAQYPRKARKMGIEGWCLIHFTVSSTGNVIEETVKIVDSEPRYFFELSCRRAVARFKFQPRMINGRGVEVPDVPYIFVFELTGPA